MIVDFLFKLIFVHILFYRKIVTFCCFIDIFCHPAPRHCIQPRLQGLLAEGDLEGQTILFAMLACKKYGNEIGCNTKSVDCFNFRLYKMICVISVFSVYQKSKNFAEEVFKHYVFLHTAFLDNIYCVPLFLLNIFSSPLNLTTNGGAW